MGKEKGIIQSIIFTGRCCACGTDTMKAKDFEKIDVCLCAWETGLAITMEFCVSCARKMRDTFNVELGKVEEFEKEVREGGR